jgi:magnesium-transporting ATPase (P-type)
VASVVAQIGNVFACRSEKTSILKLGFSSNRLVWFGIATELALIFAIVYAPPLQRIFATAPLASTQWLLLLVWPVTLLFAEERRKRVVSRTKTTT